MSNYIDNEDQNIKTFDFSFWICLLVFLVFAGIICFFPVWFTSNSNKFDFTSTGQIGDTIGGTMGPFVAIAAALLTFFAFWVQYKANEQLKTELRTQKARVNLENFESTFFEMIKLHRDNVSELNYTKYDINGYKTSNNRKVFREIFKEFIECYREVKKISNSDNPLDFINPKYLSELNKLKEENNIRANVIDLAFIDIAYSIIFFGLGIEGETVLRDRFKVKYKGEFFYRLLFYIKLKPKRENRSRYILWKEIRNLNLKDLKQLIEEAYAYRKHVQKTTVLSELAKRVFNNTNYEKYYGGHQHRLGHYFRHLFQTYKFLTSSSFLSIKQKYFYGKTLRAQLSTYEQALLFVNSVSSLGMKWEYKFNLETPQPTNSTSKHDGLITQYHLIKNLPGNHFFGIIYKKYYPNINYENNED